MIAYFLFIFRLTIDQNILKFKIAMEVFFGMNVLKTLNDLDENWDGLIKRENLVRLINLIFKKIPSIAALINNVFKAFLREKIMNLHYVLVFEERYLHQLL